MQAGWTDSLGYLTVTLDTPVEHDPDEDCLDYFSSESFALFGDGAYCRWKGAMRMNIYLSPLSTLRPSSSDIISIPPGKLRTFDFQTLVQQPIIASLTINPELIPQLSVKVQVPRVLNLCSAASAIAIVDGYNDPRSLNYLWSIYGSASDVTSLQAKLSQINSPVLQITKSDLLPGLSYMLSLSVNSSYFGFLGQYNATVNRLTQLTPTVSIDGAPSISPPLTEDFLLHAIVDASTCTINRSPVPYRFSWSVQPPTVALDWATKQSSLLVVAAGSLVTGTTYTFTVTLQKPSGEFLSEASIDITPRTVRPVAVIGGGDRRVRCNSTISLDALGSFDPMTGPTFPQFNYQWHIFKGPGSVPASIAALDPATLRLVLLDAATLSLSASTLGPGVWTFCLSVSRKYFAASLPEDLTAAAPSAWTCVDVTVDVDNLLTAEVGVDLKAGVADGVLYPIFGAIITALGVVRDGPPPDRVRWSLDSGSSSGSNIIAVAPELTPSDVVNPIPPYVFTFDSSLLSPGAFYNLTFYAYFPDVWEPVMASRPFWTPTTPEAPAGWISISPNPVASFPQRFTVLCPNWYTASSDLLPLRYSASIGSFPLFDSFYSPAVNLYIPRPFLNSEVQVAIQIADYNNQSLRYTLPVNASPDQGNLADLIVFLQSAAEARDVGALPVISYQALNWIAFNLSNGLTASLDAQLLAGTIVEGMHNAISYFPITRSTVTQGVTILQSAFGIFTTNLTLSVMNAAASILSTFCGSLPSDLGADTRYALVSIIEALLSQYNAVSSTMTSPGPTGIAYNGGFSSLLQCVTTALAPLAGIDQPAISISSPTARFVSKSMRRLDMNGVMVGDSGWPQFTLPLDFSETPELLPFDVLQLSYTASISNSFSDDRFVAPVGSLTILDPDGNELQVWGLNTGIHIAFSHLSSAPLTDEGGVAPAYCIFWDADNNKFSSNGCEAVISTENDTVCRCTHLTSFAVSFNPSFAPPTPTTFPVVLVAALVSSVLVLIVVSVVLALVLTHRRTQRSLKEKEMQRAAAKREAQLESAAHAADIAVLRSEISVKSEELRDDELRQAVHQEMAKAGLAVPPYAAPLSNTRQNIEREQRDSTSPSEAASAASVSDDTPDPKMVPAFVVRQSIDVHSTRGGGGLRFWNREMASDQMSSSRSNTNSK